MQERTNLKFFDDKTSEDAALAAKYVLTADLEEVRKIAERNPTVLYRTTQGVNPVGRTIKGTIYQMALGAGDVKLPLNGVEDYLIKDRTIERQNDIGIVELLGSILLKQPDGEAESIRQFKSYFPTGWQPKVVERTFEDQAALSAVVSAILNATEYKDWDKLCIECKPAIDKFKAYLINCDKEPITSGPQFNLENLWSIYAFIDRYRIYLLCPDQDGRDRNNNRMKLICEQVLGTLQARVPARIAQILTRGMHWVINRGEEAPRILKLPEVKTEGGCAYLGEVSKVVDDFDYYGVSSHGKKLGENNFVSDRGGDHEPSIDLNPELMKCLIDGINERLLSYASLSLTAENAKAGPIIEV